MEEQPQQAIVAIALRLERIDEVFAIGVSPVGLSMVTRLSPAKIVGLMMGAWFFATSLGNKLAGYFSGFFVASDPAALMRLYGGIAAMLLVGGIVLSIAATKIDAMAEAAD
jgi:POT family proton-dependent oligopeptide transporter